MNIKKLALTGAAAALVGGFAFAPNANATEGECDEVERVDGVVIIHGEDTSADSGGCLVLEAGGAVPVNPLDNGHIGIYNNDGAPGLYGSCDGRETADNDGDNEPDNTFKPFDPTSGESDPSKCQPGPSEG